MKEKNNEIEEKMILKHEPVPGYKTAFYVVFIIGVIYLILAIIWGAK